VWEIEDRMPKTDFKSVNKYIATQAILQRVRSSIRKAVPGAEEEISYQIPAYKLHGGSVLYLAGWKQLLALPGHPSSRRGVPLHRARSTRAPIRSPLFEPIPWS
jgi:uncharacterized protein YdhG (YjbR/CyaY superfamily)